MPQSIIQDLPKEDAAKPDALPQKLSKEQIEDNKRYSIADGSAYNVMAGFGEQYVTPYALKLGASNSQIAILASVPAFIGSLFQVVGARLADKYRKRKKVVL